MRLIDADALIEELKTPVLMDSEKANRIWEGWHECTIALKEAIDRTPTIEPKKGKRIDLISRKEALSKFEGSEEDLIPVKWARRYINEIPGLSVDLISREVVLNALDQLCNEVCIYSKPHRSVMCGSCSLGGAFDVIEGLPGAEERKEE